MNTIIHTTEQIRWNQLTLKIDSMELHFSKEVNDKDSKFKVDDHVRILKYKNVFAEG